MEQMEMVMKLSLATIKSINFYMNKSQKYVMAIFVPMTILILTFVVADKVLDGDGLIDCRTLKDSASIASCKADRWDVDKQFLLQMKEWNYSENDAVAALLKAKRELSGHPADIQAFDFNVTWWLWLIALVVIGGFEFKLFEDKK